MFYFFFFLSFVVYIFIDPSMFYLVFSAMLLSFALGHFSSFDVITRPLNLSIKKTHYLEITHMHACMYILHVAFWIIA